MKRLIDLESLACAEMRDIVLFKDAEGNPYLAYSHDGDMWFDVDNFPFEPQTIARWERFVLVREID